jgi:hypothetical protein
MRKIEEQRKNNENEEHAFNVKAYFEIAPPSSPSMSPNNSRP